MARLIQMHFKAPGPFGEQMATAYRELAESINQEPGFIWKIWTENAQTREAGGIYCFENEALANAYVAKHTQRLKAFGVDEVICAQFDINQPLTRLNHGPA